MESEWLARKKEVPDFDKNAIAVKCIEYYGYGETYEESQIKPKLIAEILAEISHGINVYLYLDPNQECDWMEVLSDGKWLSLGCCFYRNGKDEYYVTYNPDYAGIAEQVETADYSDQSVWTALKSGGQSPVSKLEAITDLEVGVKAVEYFIRTGELYPAVDWLHQL